MATGRFVPSESCRPLVGGLGAEYVECVLYHTQGGSHEQALVQRPHPTLYPAEGIG
ncbi:Uncharacterised protein [Streptococcus pneumoniae]|nr:Uncharacterised protein [Streptococcus pneumoniae]